MIKTPNISSKDTLTEILFYEQDFKSAYKNNGNNIDLALQQVSMLRNVSVDHLRTVLRFCISHLQFKKHIVSKPVSIEELKSIIKKNKK